jgi:23S rRNA (cytosine1962-C5)-methyltransferase
VEAGERFGLVVLDPPPFARRRGELAGAERGYRELNLRALRLLEPGGRLVSASCSHAVSAARYVELLAEAARDAGRAAWLEDLRGASRDHPVLLGLPESGYLKCALVRVA